MLNRYYCSRCCEEFEVEHRLNEDIAALVEEFSDCFDCKGEFLQKIGQVRPVKEKLKMKKNEGY